MRQERFGHGVTCIFFDWTKTALDSAASLTLLRQLSPIKPGATGTVPPDFLLLALAPLLFEQVRGKYSPVFLYCSLAQ